MTHSKRRKADEKAVVLAAARKHKAEDKVPLLAHATMRWGRKINGRLHYFGKVDPALPDFGAGAALAEYHRTVDDLRAGRKPRPKGDDRTTLADAANKFLSAKADLRDSGEIRPRTWTQYHDTCSRMLDVLGKHRAVADLTPDDFRKLRTAFAKGRGPVALAGHMRRARVFFRYCDTDELIDRPCRFGASFDLPSPKTLRQARAARGPRMFEPHEIRQLLGVAKPIMQAMILLGVNAGFGQSDLARLTLSALDFTGGWIDYARPKTGIGRRVPLWRETTDAVQAAVAVRPEPKAPGDRDLVFLTATGLPIVRDPLAGKKDQAAAGLTTHVDTVARGFPKLMLKAGLNGNRGFYALRHTFQTVAEGCGDFPAVDSIMGHHDGSMAGRYRERIGDDRLRKVVDHVHGWLFDDNDTE